MSENEKKVLNDEEVENVNGGLIPPSNVASFIASRAAVAKTVFTSTLSLNQAQNFATAKESITEETEQNQ